MRFFFSRLSNYTKIPNKLKRNLQFAEWQLEEKVYYHRKRYLWIQKITGERKRFSVFSSHCILNAHASSTIKLREKLVSVVMVEPLIVDHDDMCGKGKQQNKKIMLTSFNVTLPFIYLSSSLSHSLLEA